MFFGSLHFYHAFFSTVFAMNNIYASGYKRYVPIAALFFVAFIFLIFVSPGIKQGIDLKGGTSIIIRADNPLDKAVLEQALKQKYGLTELQISSVSSPGGYGLNIQFAENKGLADAGRLYERAKEQLDSNPEGARQMALDSIAVSAKFAEAPETSGLSPGETVEAAGAALSRAEEAFNLSIQETISQVFGLGKEIKVQQREVGATLSEAFYGQAIMVSLIAIILVVIVVFAFFRELVPSAAIIAAMVFDIAAALALMAFFGIPVSLSTIPALLMLIGYSIDTDILLTTRVLMRKDGTPIERAHNSMVTGLTMTGTTLSALLVMLVLSHFFQIQVVFEISAVLLFGLSADIISTWFMNAPVLLAYVEKRGASK